MSKVVPTTPTPSRAKNFTVKCSECGSEFATVRGNAKTCSTICRTKRKEELKKISGVRQAQKFRFKTKHPEYGRRYRLMKSFGISLEQYEEILSKQGGVCAVCDSPPRLRVALAVDHDHKTGEIFGILCGNCNYRLIGRIRNPQLFERAAEYLRNGSGLFVPVKKKRRRKTPRKAKNGKNS